MSHRVRIDRSGKDDNPRGKPVTREAATETEAITVAARELDIGRSGPQRIATAFNASGKPVLAFDGRGWVEGHDGR